MFIIKQQYTNNVHRLITTPLTFEVTSVEAIYTAAPNMEIDDYSPESTLQVTQIRFPQMTSFYPVIHSNKILVIILAHFVEGQIIFGWKIDTDTISTLFQSWIFDRKL